MCIRDSRRSIYFENIQTPSRHPQVLALSEPTYAARPDYIEAVQKHGMVVDWRLKIVAWFDQLGDAFDMKPETIAMATNYLDRYLSRRSCGGVNLQLAATASIFLASKVEEQRPFRTSDFVDFIYHRPLPSWAWLASCELLL